MISVSTNCESKSWSVYHEPPVTDLSGWMLYNMYTFFLDAYTNHSITSHYVTLHNTGVTLCHDGHNRICICESETSPFRNTWWSGTIALKNDEIRSKKLRCLWTNPMELTAANHVRPITDTDSVLCTLEDRAVLQSLRNTTIAPLWWFRL